MHEFERWLETGVTHRSTAAPRQPGGGVCSRKQQEAYQFAVVVFAVATILHVISVRALLFTQQPSKLGAGGDTEKGSDGQLS